MRFRGPLAGSYVGAVFLVLLALTPYLVLTTALGPVLKVIGQDVGMTQRSLQLTAGMANAAYAFGAVLSVQLTSRLRGRRLLVLYALLFTLGSVAMAWAPTPGFFIAGHVVQGLTTGLMLIAAVPPLVIAFGAEKLPATAVVLNLGIFGAVAVGPVVGGVAAGLEAWRPVVWIVAGLGLGALLAALLTFEDQEPQDRDAPWDIVSLLLAGGGTASMFFAVSELMGRQATALVVLGPLLAGAAMLLALLVHQYRVEDPLIPVRQLAHTLPVVGIIIAMAAGAASVGAVELTEMALEPSVSPIHLGMLFWPPLGAAFIAAALFGRIITTRLIPVLALGGLAVCAGGVAVLTATADGASDATVLVGTGLVGFGVGSSVAPALFMAALSLRNTQLPRVFALIELLRGAAAFLAGPALAQLAMTASPDPATGSRLALWIVFGVAAGGVLVALSLLLLGRARLTVPDLEHWSAGEGPATESTPLLARVRREDTLRSPGPVDDGHTPARPPTRARVPSD